MRIDVGEAGRMVYAFVAVLWILVIVLPAMLIAGRVGFAIGTSLPNPRFATLLGGGFAFLIVLAGSVGRRRQLDWEVARTFPVRLRTLFLAELAASAVDLLPALFALLSAALLGGIGIAQPALMALLPVPWLVAIGSLLCLRHLLGNIIASVRNGLKVALWTACIGTALLFGVSEFGTLLSMTWFRLLAVLPSTQAFEGLNDAASGHWVAAICRQVYPLLFLGLLFMAAARSLEREAPLESDDRHPGRPPRLWTFRSPAAGVARLHAISLRSSALGIISMITPLFSVLIIRTLLQATNGDALWLVPITLSWLGVINMEMLLNQFGLDAGNVRALLVLPIRTVDLLAGKGIALAGYLSLQVLPLVVMVLLVRTVGVVDLIAALGLAACQFLLQLAVGHWTSVRLPWPIPRSVLKSTTRPRLAIVFVGMAVTAISGSGVAAAYLFLHQAAHGVVLSVTAGLLAIALLVYWRIVLPMSARYLDRHRELLVQFLG